MVSLVFKIFGFVDLFSPLTRKKKLTSINLNKVTYNDKPKPKMTNDKIYAYELDIESMIISAGYTPPTKGNGESNPAKKVN
jgi:hypothetical protein